jgi:hypothetical protein
MVVEGLPHTDRDTPASSQHPPHLAHGRSTVREELEALLAQHKIEHGIRQGKMDRIPFQLSNRRADWCGERKGHG